VNVLRDTHNALVPGGELVDFHPTWPPWARVVAAGEVLGTLEEPEFPEQLRAAEAGMDEVVRQGLFRPAAAVRTREIREHYDDADELIDVWEDAVTPDLERRLRATSGRVDVVDKVVFRLYRAVADGGA
jgi:hypothetical protein